MTEKSDTKNPATSKPAGALQSIKEFMYGLTGYQFARHAVAMKHEAESLFLIVTMGDLLGIPMMPPVYALRLYPYVAPEICRWKRHLARKKEPWEKEEYDLHGL
jgi:hypothetical protein